MSRDESIRQPGLRGFAILPAGMPEPAGLSLIGRVDRFDLGAPLAVRVGAEVIVVSEHLVDAEDGWDAVRGIVGTARVQLWVVADAQGNRRQEWAHLATRVFDSGGRERNGGEAAGSAARGEPSKARLVVIIGAKGGVGKTFVAANLIQHIASLGQEVAAVDFDAAAGDLSLRLGMDALMDLASVGRSGPRPVPASWSSVKRGLPVTLWAAPPRPEFADVLDEAMAAAVLDAAGGNGAACVVVDTAGDYDQPALFAALDRAYLIVLVTTLSPGALRQARTTVDLLKRLNISVRDRLVLVANRVSRHSPVDPMAFADLVGQPPQIRIPDVGPVADLEACAGCPSVSTRAGRRLLGPIGAIARKISPALATSAMPSSPGRLGKFGRRQASKRVRALSSEERWA